MREDDAPEAGPSTGPLADGLGENSDPGGQTSTTDPYGDGGLDDETYGDDYGDAGYDEPGDGEVTDDSTVGDTGDDTYGDTYGDAYGDAGDDSSDDAGDESYGDGDDPYGDDAAIDAAESASPLEGVGFLLAELRDALFGEDDDGSVGPDPTDLAPDTDADLSGDGVGDAADLHEAGSALDLDDGGPPA